MMAVTKIVAGGVAAAALMSAAPAAAQYYPPYGGGGNVVGQVLNQVLGGGYGYGVNPQMAVNQCVNAVQVRLARSYGQGGYGQGGYGQGGYGYNPYDPYGYNNGYGYSQARVLGISRVEPRSNGGLTVRGVATSGLTAAYNPYGGYGGQQPVDLTFRCRVDYRGFISDVDINRAQQNYGNNYQPYSPYTQDYSQYGYRRY